MVINAKSSDKGKGPAPKMPNRRFGYFRDDQIMFLVTHAIGHLANNLLEQFRVAINTQLAIVKGGTVEAEVPPQIISFPQINNEQNQKRLAQLQELERLEQGDNNPSSPRLQPYLNAYSILTYNLIGAPDDPIQLLNSIKQLRRAFVNGQNFPGEVPIQAAVGITQTPAADSTTSQAVSGQSEAEVDTMRVDDVSPNWLMSAASQGSGTGGPGGIPAPFQGNDSTELYAFDDFLEEHSSLYDKGANMDVAILDTAPCAHDLVLAPKEHPENKLIQGLLGPNGKLKPYLATYEQLKRMVSTSLNRHDYKMTDHGLFAAGIIHSIVPEAQIHLIEVLNQFGVGDLMSLAEGMTKVFDQIYRPAQAVASWLTAVGCLIFHSVMSIAPPHLMKVLNTILNKP